MDNTIKLFEIDGAWADVIETRTYMDDVNKEVVLIVTARVHYHDTKSRKQAFKILVNNGWEKGTVGSDDFILKRTVSDELKISVTQ